MKGRTFGRILTSVKQRRIVYSNHKMVFALRRSRERVGGRGAVWGGGGGWRGGVKCIMKCSSELFIDEEQEKTTVNKRLSSSFSFFFLYLGKE